MIGTEPSLATGGAARPRMRPDDFYFAVHRFGIDRIGDGEIRLWTASSICPSASKISISTVDLLLSIYRKRLRNKRHSHILQDAAARTDSVSGSYVMQAKA